MMTGVERVPGALAQALAGRGYHDLTPVQRAILDVDPPTRDMLVSAPTGSGKTLAFGLALAGVVLGPLRARADGGAEGKGAPRAMVITPTRELARQIRDELDWLYAATGARVVCCTGGANLWSERSQLLAGCAIVVGSPGRLRDHIARGAIDLGRLGSVVLDEADDMLDLGFRDDLEFILNAAGPQRQTLMFSATVRRRIEDMAAKFLKDPARLDAAAFHRPHGRLRYEAVAVSPRDQENAIVNLLRYHDPQSAIVFCARRETVGELARRLSRRGFNVVSLSGALAQAERVDAMAAMRDGRAQVCVATDLAARGIDLPRLELVIHADLPANETPLIHRSGRTGRAGRAGLAVLVTPHRQRRRAEALIGRARIPVEWVPVPTPSAILARDTARLLATIDADRDVSAEEHAAAAALLAAHDPKSVAVACIRHYVRSRPAAEPLDAPLQADAPPPPRKEGAAWFTLDCGRSSDAEVRRLLPLICRLGHVTRREVGRIEIHDAETRFEIREGAADAFEAAARRGAAPGATIRRLAPPSGAERDG